MFRFRAGDRILLVLLLVIGSLAGWSQADPGETLGTVSHRVEVSEFEVIAVDGAHRVRAEGFGVIGESGKPDLPGRIFAVAIPPGAEVISVRVDVAEPVNLGYGFQVLPKPLPRVIGEEDPELAEARRLRWEEARAATYGSDEVYPLEPVASVGEAAYRRYQLVDVRVAPFRYQPQAGTLEYYPSLIINIDYRLPDNPVAPLVDFVPRMEKRAREIVANYEQAQAWYAEVPAAATEAQHDLVIITTEALVDAVSTLVDHEAGKGRSPIVVTMEWIETAGMGVEPARAMRQFLRSVYPSSEWGIEDLLLVGDSADVPMRECCFDLGYGNPLTDFYYAELSDTDAASWDSDGDGCYGEQYDDDVDLYSEINVGRIPWSDPVVVERVCQKSVAFELDDDPAYKQNILVMGGFFWADTDTAHLMEAKLDQAWMSDWTATRLYEDNSTVQSTFPYDLALTHSNARSTWTSDTFAFVNWAGHGSPTSAHIMGLYSQAFVSTSDCPLLDDDHPAIVWSDSCSTANPAYSSLARQMIGQGAVGFVGSTAVALGAPAWTNPLGGSSQSCDYWFTTKVTSGEMSQGEAHQWALLQNYTYGLWDLPRYEIYEWTLHGHPNLGMSTVVYSDGLFADSFETGNTSAWTAAVH